MPSELYKNTVIFDKPSAQKSNLLSGSNHELQYTSVLNRFSSGSSKYPEMDPQMVRFTDLYRWVAELPGFTDDIKRCNEKILEAIQMAWMEEVT